MDCIIHSLSCSRSCSDGAGWVKSPAEKGFLSFVHQQPLHPHFGLESFAHFPKLNPILSYPPPSHSNTSRDMHILAQVICLVSILKYLNYNLKYPPSSLSDGMFWNIPLYTSYVICLFEFVVSNKELFHWNDPFHYIQSYATKTLNLIKMNETLWISLTWSKRRAKYQFLSTLFIIIFINIWQ